MSETPLDRVLARLKEVRPSGTASFTTLCPAHDDKNRSLSVSEGRDKRVLLKCFAGCSFEEVVSAIHLTSADLFPPGSSRAGSALTIDDLAADKRLPREFLISLGLADRPDGVLIPYKHMDGSLAPRHRLRNARKAGAGSLWLFGKGAIVPYGLDRLQHAKDQDHLVLVEGESDCWTLWFHCLPALGIPGADMTGKLEAEHLSNIDRVYVVREPDRGGDTFVSGATARLGRLRWGGSTFVIRMLGAKDPNALHRIDPEGFKEAFRDAIDLAEPIDLVPAKEPIKLRAADNSRSAEILDDSGITALSSTSSTEDTERALRKLGSLAADTDPLLRELLRDRAVAHFKTIGLRAKVVDVALATTVSEEPGGLSGNGFVLTEDEPSPDAVDGAELLDTVAGHLSRHVVLPEHAACAIALWILHCYVFAALWISPILAIMSPQKRCGKTTLLTLVGSLVPKRILAANISSAALFRCIDKFRPTLLVDEGDTSLVKNDELRGILNAGHTRDTASVIRSAGDDHEPRVFSAWCPKALALIGRLRDTLEDRSILITLKRKTNEEKAERLRRDRIHQDLAPLRGKMTRWAKDYLEAVRGAEPVEPSGLHDRAQDNWRPLLAIAEVAGGEWPEAARQAAQALTGGEDVENSPAAIQLLQDLRDLFGTRQTDRLTSADIIGALVEMDDRPWPEWHRGKALKATGLAKLLRPFGIRPRSIRLDDAETAKGYLLECFDDAFCRYLPSQASHRNNGGISGFVGDSEPSHEPPCDGPESAKKARNGALVTGVTARRGLIGEDQEEDGETREEFEL